MPIICLMVRENHKMVRKMSGKSQGILWGLMAGHPAPASPLFTQPFIQAKIKENIKAPRHWPLCKEFTGDGEFPAQMASNAKDVSIWWRHHGQTGFVPKLGTLQWRVLMGSLCVVNVHIRSALYWGTPLGVPQYWFDQTWGKWAIIEGDNFFFITREVALSGRIWSELLDSNADWCF